MAGEARRNRAGKQKQGDGRDRRILGAAPAQSRGGPFSLRAPVKITTPVIVIGPDDHGSGHDHDHSYGHGVGMRGGRREKIARALALAPGLRIPCGVRLVPAVVALWLAGTLSLASVLPARAATSCPTQAGIGPGPAGIPGQVRVAWIDARLAHTARNARRWTWGWGIALAVGTVANLAPLPYVAREDRIDWYTGAATTVVGIVPLLIAPLDVVEDSRALHARLAAPAGSSVVDDVCALVDDAETRLLRDARNQADGQRWWLHAGNVLLNFGVGAFLAFGFHHWGAGAWNAVGGSLIGEAIILTQPTATVDDLRVYRSGALGAVNF